MFFDSKTGEHRSDDESLIVKRDTGENRLKKWEKVEFKKHFGLQQNQIRNTLDQ